MTEYTPTPDFYNDYIQHYGVKGMKWYKRTKPKYADDTDYHKKLNSLNAKDYWALVDASHAGKSKGKSSSSSSKKSKSSGTKGSGSSRSSKTTSGSSKSTKTASEITAKLEDIRKPQANLIAKKKVDTNRTKNLELLLKRDGSQLEKIREAYRKRKLKS